MMKQKKSKRPALIKYLFALPVILLLMILFQSQTLLDENSKYSSSDAEQSALISNQSISKELRKDFEDLYHTTDHYENIKKTVNKFDGLLTSYLNRYPSSKESIKTTFQNMSRFMGIHIKYGGENTRFDQFVFIVPDRLLKAFQAGELPEYSRLLDSRQSSENKIYGRRVESDSSFDTIPPMPPTAPILDLIWEQLAENDNIHVLIDGKQVTTQQAIALRGKIESSGGMTIRMNDQHKSIVDSLEIFTDVYNTQSEEFKTKGNGEELNKIESKPNNFDENKRPLELLGGNIVLTDINDKPLIVIDGVVKNSYFEVERNYTPGSVKSLRAVSEEMARQKYGEKGKYGAIEVATKKAVEEIFKVVEQMPYFPGCEDLEGTHVEKEECGKEKMLEFIYTNLKYPEVARVNGVEGTNVVQFVVEKDGSLSELNLVRTIGANTGDETMKVMKKMQDEYIWKPGRQRGIAARVLYTLPIRFKLSDNEECCDDKELGKSDSEGDEQKPWFIIDGEDFGRRTIKLDPDKVKRIDVFKGDEAIKKYGAKGMHGVVLVETKDGNYDVRTVTVKNPKPIKPVEGEIYKLVEEMPRFPGCEDMGGTQVEKEICAKEQLLKFIYIHLDYPKEARERGKEGTAIVEFVVDKNGDLRDEKMIRDVDGFFKESVLSVIDEMRNQSKVWTPGKQGGKAVDVLYTLPIRYKLEGKEYDRKIFEPIEDPNNLETLVTGLKPSKTLSATASTLNEIQIKYDTDEAGAVDYSVFNMEGKMLMKNSMEVQTGMNTKNISLDNVIPGIYVLRLRQGKTDFSRKVFINN